MDDVSLALEGKALEKSPGSDGLPVEFYRAFWHILGADLVDVLNDSFSVGLSPLLSVVLLFRLSLRRATGSIVRTGALLVYLT